jgi:hypothetical protein
MVGGVFDLCLILKEKNRRRPFTLSLQIKNYEKTIYTHFMGLLAVSNFVYCTPTESEYNLHEGL